MPLFPALIQGMRPQLPGRKDFDRAAQEAGWVNAQSTAFHLH